MNRKSLFPIILITMILLPLLTVGFVGNVQAQPLPIGDAGYKQANPFDSNPTTGGFSGIGTPTGPITNVFDGDFSGTNINWAYGSSAAGFLNVTGFKKPSDNGLTDFGITFIDVKISYRATALASSTDQYRIVYYFGGNTVELQTWVFGTNIVANTSALYPPGINSNPAVRAFSNVSKPGGGAWGWGDLANLKVGFECQLGGTVHTSRVSLYEIWITAYASPYPAANTVSVQPSAVVGLHAGDLFYVDIYVTNALNLWGYQPLINFSSTVLTAIDYFSYGPFISVLPSEIGPDYVALAYKTYDGDPRGFTGNTPLARVYFSVNADGLSLLKLSRSTMADIFGDEVFFGLKDAVFASNPFHDVAVLNVAPKNTTVLPGESLQVNVTVMNQGTFLETFDVTAFNDTTAFDTHTVTDLAPGLSEIVSLEWNTTGASLGFHQIKAEVTVAIDENPSNNVMVWNVVPQGVLVGKHDVAVTKIIRAYDNDTVVPTNEYVNVTRADIVHINVTVENLGTFSEVFNFTLVWLFTGVKGIENRTNVALDAGASRNLTFVWNTDITYPPWAFTLDRFGRPNNSSLGAIRAVATPDWSTGVLKAMGVPYEKGLDYNNVGNNDLTGGNVRINRDYRIPTAGFSGTPLAAKVTQPVVFNGAPPNSRPGTSLDLTHNLTIVEYQWDFGDGNITVGNYPIIRHAYAAVGNYSVKLTVVNNLTRSDSVKSLDIGGPSDYVRVTLRNIKVVSMDFSPTSGVVGQNVTVSVTVKNMGLDDEGLVQNNIYIYFYRDNDVYFSRVRAPDLGAFGSPGGTDTRTVKMNWTTPGLGPGVHTIKAVLNRSEFESDYADNTLVASFSFQWHNVKVSGITFSKTEATIGDSVTVSVTVLNQGNFTESFTVTAYANDTAIGTAQTVTNLAAGTSKVLEFTWDTSSLNSGTYVFRAVASNVTLEAVTSDNAFAGGSVALSSPSNMLMYIIIAAAAVIVVVALVGVYFLKFRKPK